ncbi:hypothetical protein BDA96_01G344800 [Sorghum bicolor]|uniref:Uncharacterized protein n=1 Tax=Sorghum bicolor TaxID=4558 RepID=A0A921V0U5_SORBI|nr:hypothetical protein BDA96_01G344800 [Sorghum bicolor]
MVGTGKNSFGTCPGNLQGQIIETVTAADSGPGMNEDQGFTVLHTEKGSLVKRWLYSISTFL